jgi:hypothetical protein
MSHILYKSDTLPQLTDADDRLKTLNKYYKLLD